MNNLQQQALDLASQLGRAYYQEEAKRDGQFRPVNDKAKMLRLRRLWQKAADRYRRRRGVAPLYSDEWLEESRVLPTGAYQRLKDNGLKVNEVLERARAEL